MVAGGSAGRQRHRPARRGPGTPSTRTHGDSAHEDVSGLDAVELGFVEHHPRAAFVGTGRDRVTPPLRRYVKSTFWAPCDCAAKIFVVYQTIVFVPRTIESGKPLTPSGASSPPPDAGPTVGGASRAVRGLRGLPAASGRVAQGRTARSATTAGSRTTSSTVRSNMSSGRSRLPARESRAAAARDPTCRITATGSPTVAARCPRGPGMSAAADSQAGARPGRVAERLEEVFSASTCRAPSPS